MARILARVPQPRAANVVAMEEVCHANPPRGAEETMNAQHVCEVSVRLVPGLPAIGHVAGGACQPLGA